MTIINGVEEYMIILRQLKSTIASMVVDTDMYCQQLSDVTGDVDLLLTNLSNIKSVFHVGQEIHCRDYMIERDAINLLWNLITGKTITPSVFYRWMLASLDALVQSIQPVLLFSNSSDITRSAIIGSVLEMITSLEENLAENSPLNEIPNYACKLLKLQSLFGIATDENKHVKHSINRLSTICRAVDCSTLSYPFLLYVGEFSKMMNRAIAVSMFVLTYHDCSEIVGHSQISQSNILSTDEYHHY